MPSFRNHPFEHSLESAKHNSSPVDSRYIAPAVSALASVQSVLSLSECNIFTLTRGQGLGLHTGISLCDQ